jgi:2-C-methyl-D-erythritol 4-phosphate cytidylyltransferase
MHVMQTRSIIITAGGIGKRMGTDQPKQFLELLDRPVLIHTLERLHRFAPESQFIVTLPEQHIEDWQVLCSQYDCHIEHTIVAGGQERYHSIKNALAVCTGELILVHDGVRPLVSKGTIDRLLEAATIHSAVIPVIEMKESLRKITAGGSTAVDRSAYRIVQTPQVFHADVIRNAYNIAFHESITDDASLVEESGEQIHLVDGNEENVKITTRADLAVAMSFLK